MTAPATDEEIAALREAARKAAYVAACELGIYTKPGILPHLTYAAADAALAPALARIAELEAHMAVAVAGEREQCAKVAETFDHPEITANALSSHVVAQAASLAMDHQARQIATAIRARTGETQTQQGGEKI